MTSYGLIGSETPIDDLIAEYFGEIPDNVLYDLAEDEGTALLACLLMEMRGEQTDETDDAQATYYSAEGVTVTSTEENSVGWDYAADSVMIYGFDAPLYVAFKDASNTDREIPLSPDNAPFTLAPSGGLGTSEMWYRKQTSDGSDTSFNLVAFA